MHQAIPLSAIHSSLFSLNQAWHSDIGPNSLPQVAIISGGTGPFTPMASCRLTALSLDVNEQAASKEILRIII